MVFRCEEEVEVGAQEDVGDEFDLRKEFEGPPDDAEDDLVGPGRWPEELAVLEGDRSDLDQAPRVGEVSDRPTNEPIGKQRPCQAPSSGQPLDELMNIEGLRSTRSDLGHVARFSGGETAAKRRRNGADDYRVASSMWVAPAPARSLPIEWG